MEIERLQGMKWENFHGLHVVLVRLGVMIERASHPEMTLRSTKNKKLGVKNTFQFMNLTGNPDGTCQYSL